MCQVDLCGCVEYYCCRGDWVVYWGDCVYLCVGVVGVVVVYWVVMVG